MSDLDFSDVCTKYFTKSQYDAIRSTTIGIAGAGGLGSNCALCLARSGFEKFVIADFDVVEASNLNRQAYFPQHIGQPKVICLKQQMTELNRNMSIKTHQLKLDATNAENIYKTCDVVVEAFDKPENKAWFVALFMKSTKLLVSASGLAGFGNNDRIVTKKIRDNFYLIGDGKSGVSQDLKPLSPCVTIAAAKQADAVLFWVLSNPMLRMG
jgi:sulfur carrier protein ThiS adenylyltransferase